MMMTQNLIISGLQYEELVLLQELMVLVDQTDVIDHPLLIEDRETFDSLYQQGNERMTWIVKMFSAGKVFDVEIIAGNPQDARAAALNRNPHATIVGVNARLGN